MFPAVFIPKRYKCIPKAQKRLYGASRASAPISRFLAFPALVLTLVLTAVPTIKARSHLRPESRKRAVFLFGRSVYLYSEYIIYILYIIGLLKYKVIL